MKRIFAAIKVHPGEEFQHIYSELKAGSHYDKVTWVNPTNIHITLKFFGETGEDKIPAISNRLKEIASKYSTFSMLLRGIGIFGSSYKPRVVWIGIDPNPTLVGLGQDILNEMESLGFERDRQNFVPHLTLGRIKYIDNKQRFFELIGKFKEVKIATETVNEFHLIESKLSPTGPSYDVLDTFEF